MVSGVISLLVAIFDKDVAPRGLNAVFALVRIGAGLALLYCARSGLNLIMLIFAVYYVLPPLHINLTNMTSAVTASPSKRISVTSACLMKRFAVRSRRRRMTYR